MLGRYILLREFTRGIRQDICGTIVDRISGVLLARRKAQRRSFALPTRNRQPVKIGHGGYGVQYQIAPMVGEAADGASFACSIITIPRPSAGKNAPPGLESR